MSLAEFLETLDLANLNPEFLDCEEGSESSHPVCPPEELEEIKQEEVVEEEEEEESPVSEVQQQ